MNDARQVLRWALPGWSFFLLVGLFEGTFLMLVSLAAEIAEPPLALGEPRLPWQFDTVLQGTLVSIAAGIPLGFVLWQLDALQASSGLPLTTATPDFGWRLLRHIPTELRDPWARTMWRLLHNERREPWRAPEGKTVLLGVEQPLRYSWLWRALGLVWVPGRRHYRVRSLFHAELAEAAWLHLGRESDATRPRALDLADREKTIGAIRVAVVAAALSTVVLNAVMWASAPTATAVLALAVIAPSTAVLLPFLLLRRAAGWRWPAVLSLSVLVFALSATLSRGVLATMLTTAAVSCAVLLVVSLLAALRLRPGREWIAPVATHYVPVALVSLAIGAAARTQPLDALVFGASAPVVLVAFTFCRVLNVNQRIVRQRRLALEVSVFRRVDWTEHRALFRADVEVSSTVAESGMQVGSTADKAGLAT